MLYTVTVQSANGAVGITHAVPDEPSLRWFLQGLRAGCSLIDGTVTVQHGTFRRTCELHELREGGRQWLDW